MNKLKLVLIALLLTAGATFALQPVLAEEADVSVSVEGEGEASARAEAESTCEAGPYGQCTTSAKAEAEAKATSKIVYLDREQVRGEMYHEPVDASLDTQTSLAALGSVATGMIALAVKLKQRVA
jgi:hypothetical protein